MKAAKTFSLAALQLLLGSSRRSVFGSSFAKAITEALNPATHVVHGFLCAGVEGM